MTVTCQDCKDGHALSIDECVAVLMQSDGHDHRDVGWLAEITRRVLERRAIMTGMVGRCYPVSGRHRRAESDRSAPVDERYRQNREQLS